MSAFCYDEQPLKISEQVQQFISVIKCCNNQIFNFVKNCFKKSLKFANFA